MQEKSKFPVALHPSGIFPESVVPISTAAVGVGLIWEGISLYGLADSKQVNTRPRI